MADVNEVSVAEAKALLNEHSNTLILDNRDLASYKQGCIDGAMMAHEGLIESVLGKADKKIPVLVYCYQGNSSMDVAKLFSNCGFNAVYSMTGGYAEWKRTYASS